jgi:hypothetical protein
VVWSKYLLIIARLFRFQEMSSSAIDEHLLADSKRLGIAPLLLAEKMELSRKRGDRPETLKLLQQLMTELAEAETPRSAGEAYAVGTSHFLIANLLRYGGLYPNAKSSIDRARTYFRPAILSHQIELAHCHYAMEVCWAITGSPRDERFVPPGSGESRPFAEALLTLARSHSEWARAQIAEAAEYAESAAIAFDSIGYHPYAKRAKRLFELLQVWRRLELGASASKAIAASNSDENILRALVGLPGTSGTLRDQIARLRVSHVVGLLQFASSFNADWTVDIGQFDLPPLLKKTDTGFEWSFLRASSLAQADKVLRSHLGVPLNMPVPLIAD